MSRQVPPKNSRTPQMLSDGSTRPFPATHPPILLPTIASRSWNPPPGQASSPPSLPSTSNRPSSPSVRALARQNTANQVQSRVSGGGAFVQRPSVPSGSITFQERHATRPSTASQPTAAINRPVSSSRASPVRVQKRTGPIRRKLATPIKTITWKQPLVLLTKQAGAKPFEKIAALADHLRTASLSSKFSDDLRRLQLATTIHHNVETSIARRLLIYTDGLTKPKFALDRKDLGLSQLSIAEDRKSCSFCIFECNYGSSNVEVLLPASASRHRCLGCQPSRFFEDGHEITEPRQTMSSISLAEQANKPTSKHKIRIRSITGGCLAIEVELSDTVLDVKSQLSHHNDIDWETHHLVSEGAVLLNDRLLSTYRIGPKSRIAVVELKRFNGFDVTQFWKPTFCSGCPWTQVDVKVAKLCMSCADEKHKIVDHAQHGAWTRFFKTYGDNKSVPASYRQGNCMICPNLATVKCAGCPLIVCDTCSTHLDGRCKGSLTILLYSFAHEHIRNDAFLLRSDGGGF